MKIEQLLKLFSDKYEEHYTLCLEMDGSGTINLWYCQYDDFVFEFDNTEDLISHLKEQ